MTRPNAASIACTRTYAETDGFVDLTGVATPDVTAGPTAGTVTFPGVTARGAVHHVVKERDQKFKTRILLTSPNGEAIAWDTVTATHYSLSGTTPLTVTEVSKTEVVLNGSMTGDRDAIKVVFASSGYPDTVIHILAVPRPPFIDGYSGTDTVGVGRGTFRMLTRRPVFGGMMRTEPPMLLTTATVVRGTIVKEFLPVVGNATDIVAGYKVVGDVPRDVTVDTATGRVTITANFTTLDDTTVTLVPFNMTGDGPAVTISLAMRELTPSYLDVVSSLPSDFTAFDVIDPIMVQTDAVAPREFTAENLPPGLFIDPATGKISGIPVGVTKTYETEITITNQDGSFTTVLTIPVVNDGGAGDPTTRVTPELIHSVTRFVDTTDPFSPSALSSAGSVFGSSLSNAALAAILRNIYQLRRSAATARDKRVNSQQKANFNDPRNDYVIRDSTGVHYKRPPTTLGEARTWPGGHINPFVPWNKHR